jgi:hypothetical protein
VYQSRVRSHTLTGWVVITGEPVYLCDRGGVERGVRGTGSEELSLMSYSLKYISLVVVGILCQFGLRKPSDDCLFIITGKVRAKGRKVKGVSDKAGGFGVYYYESMK